MIVELLARQRKDGNYLRENADGGTSSHQVPLPRCTASGCARGLTEQRLPLLLIVPARARL